VMEGAIAGNILLEMATVAVLKLCDFLEVSEEERALVLSGEVDFRSM
jgi:hypothetical protein